MAVAARYGRGVATRGQLSLTSRGDKSTRYGTPTSEWFIGSGTGGEGPWCPTWRGPEGLRKGPSKAAGAQAAGVATGSDLRQAELCSKHVWFGPPLPTLPAWGFPQLAQGGNRNSRPMMRAFLSFLAGTGEFEGITHVLGREKKM